MSEDGARAVAAPGVVQLVHRRRLCAAVSAGDGRPAGRRHVPFRVINPTTRQPSIHLLSAVRR
jgi:hypothetical protein